VTHLAVDLDGHALARLVDLDQDAGIGRSGDKNGSRNTERETKTTHHPILKTRGTNLRRIEGKDSGVPAGL
jgi:hypothetical protein